jgi:hypothetical protein
LTRLPIRHHLLGSAEGTQVGGFHGDLGIHAAVCLADLQIGDAYGGPRHLKLCAVGKRDLHG